MGNESGAIETHVVVRMEQNVEFRSAKRLASLLIVEPRGVPDLLLLLGTCCCRLRFDACRDSLRGTGQGATHGPHRAGSWCDHSARSR